MAYIVPPPRRRASPSSNAHRRGLLLRSLQSLPRKPVLQRLKGGGTPTAVAVGCKVEKNANIHVCIFFCYRAASCRPTTTPTQQVVLRPPRLSSYIKRIVLRPTVRKVKDYPAYNPLLIALFAKSAHLTVGGDKKTVYRRYRPGAGPFGTIAG